MALRNLGRRGTPGLCARTRAPFAFSFSSSSSRTLAYTGVRRPGVGGLKMLQGFWNISEVKLQPVKKKKTNHDDEEIFVENEGSPNVVEEHSFVKFSSNKPETLKTTVPFFRSEYFHQ